MIITLVSIFTLRVKNTTTHLSYRKLVLSHHLALRTFTCNHFLPRGILSSLQRCTILYSWVYSCLFIAVAYSADSRQVSHLFWHEQGTPSNNEVGPKSHTQHIIAWRLTNNRSASSGFHVQISALLWVGFLGPGNGSGRGAYSSALHSNTAYGKSGSGSIVCRALSSVRTRIWPSVMWFRQMAVCV